MTHLFVGSSSKFFYPDHIPTREVAWLEKKTYSSRFLYPFARLLKEHPEYEKKYIFLSNGDWIKPLTDIVKESWISKLDEIPKSLNNLVKYPPRHDINNMLKRLDPKTETTRKLLKRTLIKFFGTNFKNSNYNHYDIVLFLEWKNKHERLVSVYLVGIPREKMFEAVKSKVEIALCLKYNPEENWRFLDAIYSGSYYIMNEYQVNKHILVDKILIAMHQTLSLRRECFLQLTMKGKLLFMYHVMKYDWEHSYFNYDDNAALEEYLFVHDVEFILS